MITFPAILEKLETKKDGSVKIVFETREFNSKDSAELFALRQTEGHLLYQANRFEDNTKVPEAPADSGRGDKSPSQRLRAVLWVWWDTTGRPTTTFEEFYRTKMEQIIDQVKDKLD